MFYIRKEICFSLFTSKKESSKTDVTGEHLFSMGSPSATLVDSSTYCMW